MIALSVIESLWNFYDLFDFSFMYVIVCLWRYMRHWIKEGGHDCDGIGQRRPERGMVVRATGRSWHDGDRMKEEVWEGFYCRVFTITSWYLINRSRTFSFSRFFKTIDFLTNNNLYFLNELYFFVLRWNT